MGERRRVMANTAKKSRAAAKAAPAAKASAKKATPAKPTPAKAPPRAAAADKPKLRKGVQPGVPESSSNSSWELQALKVSGTRKRKASELLDSEQFHRGSIPAQGTKPLKRSRSKAEAPEEDTKKKKGGAKAVSVVAELR